MEGLDELRFRRPSEDDYPDVLAALDTWWGEIGGDDGGTHRAGLLPRLFFQHFNDTSIIVHHNNQLVAFLVGFLSQSAPREAYIHFVGVAPEFQAHGLGRELYERFFALAADHGRDTIRAITSVSNLGSQQFHRRLGFRVSTPIPNYDGQDADRVTFVMHRPLRLHGVRNLGEPNG